LDTGEKTDVNGDVNFTAASTGKVIPALLFLKKVEEGKFSLNQYFSDYSASFELKQMINRSNNESWALFNKILGISNEEKYANNIGIEYDGNDNILTANDYALVLSKLYKGELLNKEHTDLLLSYMKGTNEERLIPAALPKADVNHKYGMLGGYIHDGAIVNDGTNKYVLVIYSRNDKNQDPDLRASMFKKIADAINSKLNN
jgi:beta-lactamase class A